MFVNDLGTNTSMYNWLACDIPSDVKMVALQHMTFPDLISLNRTSKLPYLQPILEARVMCGSGVHETWPTLSIRVPSPDCAEILKKYSSKFRAIEISIKETSSVSAEILSAISRQTILALSMNVIHSHTVVESIFKILDGFGEVHLFFRLPAVFGHVGCGWKRNLGVQ
jgi:hypothetical protein